MPRVVVIGGGGTGAAILYDLARRGFPSTLFERGELTSGTTGRHHGQLHSGARYAVRDRDIARECMEESLVLRTIAPDAIELNFGMFVALDESDEREYLPQFLDACSDAGIPARVITGDDARAHEPGLSGRVRCAVVVPDGTMDAYRLPMQFFATARRLGAAIRTFTPVVGIETSAGRLSGVRVRSLRDGAEYVEPADVVINAGGAWSDRIASLAGVRMAVTPAPGTLVAVRGRLVNMIISRLRPPSNGDIIVPQRNLTIVGTTEWVADDPDTVRPRPGDVEWLRESGSAMVPDVGNAPVHAAWSAPRPLAGLPGETDAGDTRGMSRDFLATRHPERSGFYSVVGGKATVLRAMAETIVDLVCADSGREIACTTANDRLDHYRDFHLIGDSHEGAQAPRAIVPGARRR